MTDVSRPNLPDFTSDLSEVASVAPSGAFPGTSNGSGTKRRLFARLATLLIIAVLTLAVVYETQVSLFKAFATFFVSLAVLLLATEEARIGRRMAAVTNRIAEWLALQGAFRSDPVAEAPKFALLRIAFGLFLLQRAAYMIFYMFPSDWSDPLMVTVMFANLTAALLLIVGFFTQATFVFLILLQWQSLENVTWTSTLGNDIAALFALLLVFANAGAHYSLDGYLAKRSGILGRLIRLTYYPLGLPPRNTLQMAKLLSLTGYWCVCVYSLSMHISEPAWMSGVAGPLLLTNNFMSRYYLAFEWFFELGPWAVVIGKVALWAMLPWYALVMPAVLAGGIWRTYVIVWALLFFALSLFVLQLGWLAHFEFLFLAGLFWERRFIKGPKTLLVAYDDRCNLCDRTVTFIKTVDIFNRVELRPLSKNASWLEHQGIRTEDALRDLYGIETDANNRQSKGYDFYIALSRRILLLLPAYPVLLLGKWLGIGPLVYRYVADRRTNLFGVCELPSPKPEHRLLPPGTEAPVSILGSDPIAPIAVHFSALCLAYLAMIPTLLIDPKDVPLPESVRAFAADAGAAAHIYGVAPINVFNYVDLKMAETWFTLSAVQKSGESILLPILSEQGTRLAMHASDRVYFGYTLWYRRSAIGHQECLFDRFSEALRLLASTYRSAGDQLSHFAYRQYYQPLPDSTLLVTGQYVVQPVMVACTVDFPPS